tara:strand:- start:2728 stop:3702 length:975 start_codon:yes stop_codon:yes gene_type:complete
MENFSLSIIIPTYKRNQKLKKIIYSITRQCPLSIKIEVIIISEINNGLQFFLNYPIKKKNIKFRVLTVRKNSNAIKRNKGIESAKGKYLILLDDDCLPDPNFLKDYLNLFKNISDHEILCGSIKYLNSKIKKENFTRYRQSRHFIYKSDLKSQKKNLPATNIVTMNMGMKNSKLLKKTKYFNKNFGGYGFEDYEFGFRLISNGFTFLQSKPTIYHLDDRNYRSYLNKIYFLSRYSVTSLKKINYQSWKCTIYYKIENNFIVNFFSKVKLIYLLIEILEKLIEFIERNIFLYIPKLYRLGIFLSYCRGYYDRKYLKKHKNYDWYK